MKVLGIHQFHQKKFKTIGLTGKWLATMGDLPKGFMGIIYGNAGGGKTELSVQFAKELCSRYTVGWLSYEQGHGYDLQKATLRNKMDEHVGKFFPIDPNKGRKEGLSLLEELDRYIGKRNSPDFIFIDSLDYTRFDFEQYDYLKQKYGEKKGIIWLSHADPSGKMPKSVLGKQIEYDGAFGLNVRKYIAYVNKNRFGGIEDYIIYEKMAREKNPLYFRARETEMEPPKEKKKNKIEVSKKEQTEEVSHE